MRPVISVFFFFILRASVYAQPLLEIDSAQYKAEVIRMAADADVSFPFVSGDKFYYLSNQPVEEGVKNLDVTGKALYRIYCAEGSEKKGKQIFESQYKQTHEGPFFINEAGDRIWYTANKISRKGKDVLTIREAVKVNGSWVIQPIPFFDTLSVSVCHPLLLQSESKMIFAADFDKAGFGGMDLYSLEKINGRWENLTNLGKSINSSGNELYPAVDGERLLYISNRAKRDYNIFAYHLATGRVSLLPPPFNSAAPETGFAFSRSQKCWYVSGKYGDKNVIRKISFLWPKSVASDTVSQRSYCYGFSEESSVGLDDTLQAVYEWDFGDGHKRRGLTVDHCFAEPGTYNVSLNIIDKSTGVLFFNQVNYVMEVSDSFRIDSRINKDTLVWIKKHAADSVRRVYVEADEMPLYAGIKKSIALPVGWKVLKEYYWMICSGKEDTICRVRRRDFSGSPVMDTLLRIAQPPDLNFKIHLGGSDSLFSTHPIQTLVRDTVTFIQTPDRKYHYFAGNYDDIDSTFKPASGVRGKGFSESTVIAFEKNKMISNQKLNGELSVIRNCLHLYSVNYKPSRYELEPFQQDSLKSLVLRLKGQEKIKLIVVSTTDPTGSKKFNEFLSEKRSDAVISYLHKLGIRGAVIEKQKKPLCENVSQGNLLRESKIYLKYEN